MTPPAPVSVIGFGGCTSLGYSLRATLAAMGAGLANFSDSGIVNVHGTPASVGALLGLEMSRADRLTMLARLALDDLRLACAGASLEAAPFMIGTASDLDRLQMGALERTFGDLGGSKALLSWYPFGRASSLLALSDAVDLVGAGAHRFAVVGGVDSLCAAETVRALVRSQRVLGPHVEGTIPAEAAAFAVLARSDDPVVALSGATSVEVVVRAKSPVPYLQADRISAEGLASAFRALREAGAQRVDRVIAAHSGEGYFGRGFTSAYLREMEIMPEPLQVDLTADCLGDVGAATGVCALAFGAHIMAEESMWDGRTSRVLAYTESDTGEIGAAIIEGGATQVK